MPLVAPGVARFSLNGNMGSTNRWANIWDVRMLGGIDDDRAEGCEAYARHILDMWQITIATEVSSSVVLESVSWVDLNTATGSTGQVSEGLVAEPPYVGTASGAMSPRNVSVLLRKQVVAARGRRSGRMYVPGIPEAEAGEGSIGTGPLADFQTAATGFLAALTDPPEAGEFSMLPCVVHTRNDGTEEDPVIVYVSNSVISELVVDATLATQRRRLRR